MPYFKFFNYLFFNCCKAPNGVTISPVFSAPAMAVSNCRGINPAAWIPSSSSGRCTVPSGSTRSVRVSSGES